MEDRKYSRIHWLTTATRGIRFGPDREEVARELRDHLDDRIADLERIFPGMTYEEAEERALAGMGDPEEVGRELARVHRPWLGWLWRASRWVLLGAVCALAVALVSALFHQGPLDRLEEWTRTRRESGECRVIAQVLYEDAAVELLEPLKQAGDYRWEGLERLALYTVDERRRLGEADVTLSRAALWRTEGGNTLYVEMAIDYDRARDRSPALDWYLQAEDSLGNHYGHEMVRRDTGASMSGFPFFGVETRRRGCTWNFGLDGLPEEAEWVRFTYSLRPGSGFEFVIDLAGEVGP